MWSWFYMLSIREAFLIIALRWILVKAKADGAIYYLFLYMACSRCSHMQSQEFPHPARAVRCVVMITNVIIGLAFTARGVLNCRRVVAKF